MNLYRTINVNLLRKNRSTKGVTLVELMIVVAIIGILASIASVAYGRYIKAGKIQRLQQLALDVASGQERYRSRNNLYYPADGTAITYNATSKAAFENLLDFTTVVPSDVVIEIDAWDGSGPGCDICGVVGVDTTRQGFGVSVRQQLTAGGVETTVIQTSGTPTPVILNEGE